jgi:hypothetical protein
MTEQRIWTVAVLGEGIEMTGNPGQKKPRERLVRRWFKVQVVADDNDAAGQAARDFVENIAPIGPLWKLFTPMQISRVVFPYCLEGGG